MLVLANLAVELERAVARRRTDGAAGRTTPRLVARGEGWTVADVVCTCGPDDRPFEEQHSTYAIAIVLAGTFQYRSAAGGELMTPGSLMLGNRDQCFTCGHQHGEGDRCLSFWYDAAFFERLAADAGARGNRLDFPAARVPPIAALSALTVRGSIGLAAADDAPWEELAIALAGEAVALARGCAANAAPLPLNADARVTRIVRFIDRYPDADLQLPTLARAVRLSPYHFLRTFERATGITPHQYVRRARLRAAAARLAAEPDKILDVALDCGFNDVSNFNRAFRAEFGVSPRAFRVAASPR